MDNTGNHRDMTDIMSYDMDTSIDEKVFDTQDFKIDLNGILGDDDVMQNTHEKQDFDDSPSKRVYSARSYSRLDAGDCGMSLEKVILQPTNDDLFQVTNNTYKSPQKKQRSNYNFNGFFDDNDSEVDNYSSEYSGDNSFIAGQRLKNNKMHKLVDDLSRRYASENPDYELDDQLRTRFYKGRFNKNQNHFGNSDPLDLQLEEYLTHPTSIHNDNKENLTYNSINKHSKESSLKRSNKGILKTPKRNTKIKSKGIPILKPLTNFPNIELQRISEFSVKKDVGLKRQEIGICIPKHRQDITPKSSIKYSSENIKIYLVDSSTGLINDATRFGTELNASNCEGFPLPEDINEIVQIPTNEDSRPEKKKLAIIKLAMNNSVQPNTSNAGPRTQIGFYSKQALHNYKEEGGGSNADSSEVQVISQPVINPSSSANTISSKKVQWAEELEW